jgi:hypothetical protein
MPNRWVLVVENYSRRSVVAARAASARRCCHRGNAWGSCARSVFTSARRRMATTLGVLAAVLAPRVGVRVIRDGTRPSDTALPCRPPANVARCQRTPSGVRPSPSSPSDELASGDSGRRRASAAVHNDASQTPRASSAACRRRHGPRRAAGAAGRPARSEACTVLFRSVRCGAPGQPRSKSVEYTVLVRKRLRSEGDQEAGADRHRERVAAGPGGVTRGRTGVLHPSRAITMCCRECWHQLGSR